MAARYNSGVGLNQRLYVQQDANFNVTSVSNSLGATVERYRFTPYGQRTVLNDDFTVNANPTTSDYGFSVGHQGLLHDAETNLIYNRARYLHNTLGRFTAEDPLGTAYQDGMNLYEYGPSPRTVSAAVASIRHMKRRRILRARLPLVATFGMTPRIMPP
ncbi:MAG TPA: RHS repeat-associated core domain-containing protein [Tepidisphaeraceae bacterium]|nr:RHS repeat-associated core domain-containing protein [Tepidisphaeraceae bacterium]